MNDPSNIFIGINVSTGKYQFAWIMMDDRLNLLSTQQGNIDDIIAQITDQGYAFIAITSPSRTNIGLLKNSGLRRRLTSSPRKGRCPNMRVAEYEMRLAGLPHSRTPAHLSRCSKIVQRGFSLYQRLEQIGCRSYPTSDAAYQWMEVSPEAAFRIIFEGQNLFKPKTLEGRLQRQLILFEQKLSIPDPMFFYEEVTRYRLIQGILPIDRVFSTSKLNALVAAYTAWLTVNNPRQVSVFGIAQEGLIYLPGSPTDRIKPNRFISLNFDVVGSSEMLFQDNQYE